MEERLIKVWCNTCGIDLVVVEGTPVEECECAKCRQWWIDNAPKEEEE